MSKVVLICDLNTFRTLSVPDSIPVETKEAPRPVKGTLYQMTIASNDIVSVLEQMMKPSVLAGTKQFKATKANTIKLAFVEKECNRPLYECQTFKYATENNLGMYIWIVLRSKDGKEYYDYVVTANTSHDTQPVGLAAKLAGECANCKRKMCKIPYSK